MANKPQSFSKGQREEAKSILRREVLTWTLTGLALLGGIMGISLWKIKGRIENKMELLVAKQFEEPRIKEVVRQVAVDRAQQILTAEIQPEVSQFKDDVESELQEVTILVDKMRALEEESQLHRESVTRISSDIQVVGGQIDNANARLRIVETNLSKASVRLDTVNEGLEHFSTELKEVTDEQRFLSLANRARLFSLDAYLDLERLAATTNAFSKDAGQIVWALQRQMKSDRSTFLGEFLPIEQDGDYRYSGPFTSDEIAMMLQSGNIEGSANYSRKNDLLQLVPELYKKAFEEENLWVQNRITFALSSLTGETFYPWTIDKLSAWWSEHSHSYTNWPYSTYSKAMGELYSTHYENALKDFKAVLKHDSDADMSRAYAVACAAQAGFIEEAEALCGSWKTPDARWPMWAKAKLNLAKGEVTSATMEFVEIAKKYKGFPMKSFMKRGNDILSDVDWDLYEQELQKNPKITE